MVLQLKLKKKSQTTQIYFLNNNLKKYIPTERTRSASKQYLMASRKRSLITYDTVSGDSENNETPYTQKHQNQKHTKQSKNNAKFYKSLHH